MNTSQLLQTLGLLLQAPSMYQQAKSESDTARVQKMLEDAKLYRYKNPTTFNISTPRLDFTTAGIKREPLPETTLADLRPDVFGEIQKNPQALLQFMTTPNASQTFNAAQTLGFLPKDKTGNEKDKFPIEIGGKTYYTTSNEIYIDYLTKKGRFAPDDNKITRGLKDAQTLASLRAMEIDKNLDDMEPKDAADLIMKSGRELNPDFDKTIGGDVLVVKRPKGSFWGGTKSFYFWGEDKEEILAAQKALKNGVMTPAEYEDFLKVMTGE